MTQVAIIDVKEKKFRLFDSKEKALSDAFEAAGLKKGQVDFGAISQNYSIIVYEFGLSEGNESSYFRLGTQLFNGNAILFYTDYAGETIGFPPNVLEHLNSCKEVEFFTDIPSVEAAITAGRVHRPSNKINGEIFWEWNR